MLFGLQALINMAVNVGMLPAKGMTLALHLLWRLVAARHGADHGLCARADAQTTDGGAARSGARRGEPEAEAATSVREQAA